jgi:ClpP class serine protease
MARFPAGKVSFIAVNQGETADVARQFLLARKLQLRVALDPRQKTGALLGASAIPHTVVIDREGKIVWVRTGASNTTAQETAEVVAKLLAR